MSVLDLPIEKQHELAALEGKPLAAWRTDTAEFLKSGREFAEQCRANSVCPEHLPPEEREAWERFQARVDDEVLTNAVLSRRAEEAKRKA